MKRAALRIQELVGDMLALSGAGHSNMLVQDVALDECVAASLAALDARVRVAGAKCTSDALPKVRGDRRLLTQIYHHLISNGLEFQPEGRTPRIRATAEHGGEGAWVFGVQDNGIGIPAECAEDIFAPFKPLHGRQAYQGSGVGLAICRKAIERHGGRIWVESKPGDTHVRFTLNEFGVHAENAST